MNADIWYLIADHVQPHPLTYTRLAAVSKHFYSLFTSDRLWMGLNPYGVESNIHKSFWQACDNDPIQAKISCLFWQDPGASPPIDNNLFSWLGYLRLALRTQSIEVPRFIEDNTQLFRCLFTIWGETIAFCSPRVRSNKELALIAIKNSPFLLDSLPELNSDKEVVMAGLVGWRLRPDFMDWRGSPLIYVSEELRDDADVVALSCKQYGKSFADASPRLQRKRQLVSEIISHQGDALAFTDFMDDREMFLTACRTAPSLLLYSPTFVDDREIVLTAVSVRESRALLAASPRLRSDRKVFLTAIRSGAYFPHPCVRFEDDREIALALMDPSSTNSRLDLISPRLRDDHEIVLKAVLRSGKQLKNATERLRDDKSIVLAATSQAGSSLEYASFRLRNDLEVVLMAINQDPLAFSFASTGLKETNKKLIDVALTLPKSIFNILPPPWRESRDIIKATLSKFGDDLRQLSISYRADVELVTIAVAQCGMAIRFADPALLNDRKIVATAVSQDARVLNLIPEELRNDIELMEIAIKNNPMALRYAPQFCGNKKLAVMAIERNYRAYLLVDDALKRDYMFNFEAVRASGYVFSYLPELTRLDPFMQRSARILWTSSPNRPLPHLGL